MKQRAAETEAPPAFNPMSPEFIRNPYPDFHWLRVSDPIHRTMLGFWVATRYEDVNTILRDRRFGKGFVERTELRYGEQALQEPIFASMRHWILVQDPPDHTRLRALVAKAFTPRTIDAWRPRIQQLVDELLNRAADRKRMDFIADFAHPLPINVICDMLGIPPEDRDRFTRSAQVSGRVIDPTPMSREELDAANASYLEQIEYFRNLYERRQADPGEDLISLLVHAEEQGDQLTQDELIANVFLLFGAGHETTVNLLGNGLYALLRERPQWEKLKNDPSLAASAVEELLRYDSSVQLTARTALEDVEVGGTKIETGETILCLLGAGNRDPEVFDQPDELRIDRPENRPLSFGGGIHMCLGARLARIEGEIALRALAERLPDLHLDFEGEPNWRPTVTLRGLTELPVAW